MKKNKLLFLTIAIIITIASFVIIYLYIKGSDSNDTNISNNINNTINNELLTFINSRDDLKKDTNNYKKNINNQLKLVFDNLNNNTDLLLDYLFDNTSKNIDTLVLDIQNDERKINNILNNAIKNAESTEYKKAYTALKKYINIQNKVIYDLVEKYKTEKVITYDTFYNQLHNTHGNLTEDEMNSINFLSGVDSINNETY